jgi:hypothetical protein
LDTSKVNFLCKYFHAAAMKKQNCIVRINLKNCSYENKYLNKKLMVFFSISNASENKKLNVLNKFMIHTLIENGPFSESSFSIDVKKTSLSSK